MSPISALSRLVVRTPVIVAAALLAACSDATAPDAAPKAAPQEAQRLVLAGLKVLRYTETCVGTTCTFDASASSGFTSYLWIFGDGTAATGLKVTHTYPSADASYMLQLSGSGTAAASVRKLVYCNDGSCF